MGLLDGPARAVSKDVIGALGATVTMNRPLIEPEYDPEDGQWDEADEELTVSAVIEDSDSSDEAQQGSPTRARGEYKVTVPADDDGLEGHTPDESWTIEFGGHEHDIEYIDRIYSGDQVALYVLWTAQ